jgi:hypothetical protein
MQKLPPYGKQLLNSIALGENLTSTIYIYIGWNAWSRAKKSYNDGDLTLCIPPYQCPTLYHYPVSNCNTVILSTPEIEDDYLEDLILSLYKFKANMVAVITGDNELLLFKKDF